jgi:hypothetical protein
MPFVPVPNTLAVDVLFLLDGQRMENTLYFEKPDGWTGAQIADWLDQLRTLISADLMPLLATAIQFLELVGRLLDTASSIGLSLPITPDVTGGVAVEPMPNNVAYTISFKTGLSGRSFRGRNYIGGLPNTAVTGNDIEAGTRTGLLDYYTALQAMADSNGTPWVVVSRFSGVDPITGDPIPRVTGVTTPILTVSTFDLTVDSQRRRLPGRGS